MLSFFQRYLSYDKMAREQRCNWDDMSHFTIEFDNVQSVECVEYVRVCRFGIGTTMPVAVTLRRCDDGIYRIPMTPIYMTADNWIVIRVNYPSAKSVYGLITARHLSDLHVSSTKGHPLKEVCMLARAPLAWVKMCKRDKCVADYFSGDAVQGHHPDVIVSRIYSTIDRVLRNTHCPDDMSHDDLAFTRVRDTLAALSAPLAFKVIHEQSKLSFERLILAKDLRCAMAQCETDRVWGICVLWHEDQAGRVIKTLDSRATITPPNDSRSWVRVTLTAAGLAVTRWFSGVAPTTDTLKAPYWSIILTALCTGSLEVWSQQTLDVFGKLRCIPDEESGHDICQRCGYTYNAQPVASSKPKRTFSVVQIDELLTGKYCTSLCAVIDGSLCLNHARVYEHDRQEKRGREDDEPVARGWRTEILVDPRANETVSSWWMQSGCYWGQRELQRAHQPGQNIETITTGPDFALWRWREIARDSTVSDKVLRLRWERKRIAPSQRAIDGVSTTADVWTGLCCRDVGYHVKTIPFGEIGGFLVL